MPTNKDRAVVKAMTAYGVPQHNIAKILGIHDDTLRKHYAHEMEIGLAEANSQVAQSLFANATKLNNVAAQIFWLKTRGQGVWKEPALKVEVTQMHDTTQLRQRINELVDRGLSRALTVDGEMEDDTGS